MVSVQFFGFLFVISFLYVGHASKCPPSFNCGNLGNKIQFPFTSSDHPDCGFLVIYGCYNEEPNVPKFIKYNEKWLEVVELNQLSITIRDKDIHDLLLSNSCSVFSYDLPSITSSPFISYPIDNIFTIFVCDLTSNLTKPIQTYYNYVFDSCSEQIFYKKSPYLESDDDYATYLMKSSSCKRIQLPIGKDTDQVMDKPFTFLSENITISPQLTPQCRTCYYVDEGKCQLDSKGRFNCAKGNLYVLCLLL